MNFEIHMKAICNVICWISISKGAWRHVDDVTNDDLKPLSYLANCMCNVAYLKSMKHAKMGLIFYDMTNGQVVWNV